MQSMVVSVFLLAGIGCLPQKELSAYSEGAAPELDRAPREAVTNSETPSGAGMSPAADDAPTPIPAAAVEETGPSSVPLDQSSTSTGESDTAGDPVASDAAPPAAPPEAPSCEALGGFTIAATESCYILGDNVSAWQDARNFCQAWGGDLVEIDSDAENEALARRIEANVWIGATDQEEEGTFRWAGGAPLAYVGWGRDQPNDLEANEDCSELRLFDDRWGDVPCAGDVTRRALCERA